MGAVRPSTQLVGPGRRCGCHLPPASLLAPRNPHGEGGKEQPIRGRKAEIIKTIDIFGRGLSVVSKSQISIDSFIVIFWNVFYLIKETYSVYRYC